MVKTVETTVMENAKSEMKIKKIFGNITRWLIEIYVLFYLCIFPLSLRDKYYDILTFRFALFWKPTLAYGCIFLVLVIAYLLCDVLYNKGEIGKKLPQKLKAGIKSASGTDIAFTFLILIFTISTIFAEYPYEAFWGDRGRSQGLLLWLMFYIAYILITRFYRYRKWHLYAFMFFSCIVCLWGICNYFMITFSMFEETSDEYKYLFVSSIGNINTYNNFTAIIYGVAAIAFMLSKKGFEYIYTFAVLIIATLAQIMGKSDNILLSTAAVWTLIPLLFIKNRSQIYRFFLMILIFAGALKGLFIIDQTDIPNMNDINPSTLIALGGKSFMTAVIVLLLIGTSAAFIYSCKGTELSDKAIACIRRGWLALILSGLAIVIAILVMANTGVYSELWEPYSNLLIFNESWGTFRGLIWKMGLTYWKNDATMFARIFGYGPDTYYIITMDRFFDIMFQNNYGYFDSAHNEYLEYFITVGIAGLIAYLALLYTSLKTMLLSHENGSWMIAAGVIAYAVQAVVNIAIPITTPVLMVLMFVGVAAGQSSKNYSLLS